MTILRQEQGSDCEQAAEQALEICRQLKLNDPAVIRYYEKLEEFGRQQQDAQPVWLRTNIHSVAPV